MKNIKSILIIFLFTIMSTIVFAQELHTTIVDNAALISATSVNPVHGDTDGYIADDFEISPSSEKSVSGTTDGLVADDFEVSPNDNGSVPSTPIDVTDKKATPGIVSGDGSGDPETPTTIINSNDDGAGVDKVHNAEVKPTLYDQEKTGGAVVTEYDVYIGGEAPPEVQLAITNLKVKPAEIFSPVFSGVENLVVNSEIVDEKVVYNLEAEDASKPIFKANEVIQPIFDLRVEQPVEFKLHDKKIIVNNEQIIDYKGIVRENEVMPPVEIEIHSTVTEGKVYDLTVVPCPESAEFKFMYSEKEVMVPIYSDFKVEDKKLHLISDGKVHDLKVLPQEIYFGVNDLAVKKPKIVIKELSLKVEDEKPIYDLRVEEPFKLFWLFSKKIQSRYIISSEDGTVIKKKKPWYTFLGSTDEDDDDIVFLRPE